jgi:hypothetical protein
MSWQGSPASNGDFLDDSRTLSRTMAFAVVAALIVAAIVFFAR